MDWIARRYAGPAPGSSGAVRRGQARLENKAPRAIKAVRQGQVESAQATPTQTPKWTGSLESTSATEPRNRTHPIDAGSSRRTTQLTPTHQTKQARSSLRPRPVENQTIKKRGIPKGPRSGPLGQSGEDKRVSESVWHHAISRSGEDEQRAPIYDKARPARTSKKRQEASPARTASPRQGRLTCRRAPPPAKSRPNLEPERRCSRSAVRAVPTQQGRRKGA